MQTKNMYGNANKGVDDKFPFQRILSSFFKDYVLGGISQTNCHLLILDNHRSHVTLEALEQAMAFGLNMLTLPWLTSHAFQPLDVSCFKPFKSTFKKRRMRLWLKTNTKNQTKLHLLARWIKPWTNP
jgi:hypothetical protein